MKLDRDTPLGGRQETPPALAEREIAVLGELGRDGDARVAFQGLRRRLDLHQEALARTLRRLEREGLVAKDEKGYRLTDAGFGALAGRPRTAPPPKEVLPLVQALLPPHVAPDAVADLLSRRWFRGLRWYGQSDGPGETTLTWLVDGSNTVVRVRLAGASFVLEVEGATANDRRAYAAARGLLAALAELYGLPADEGGYVNAMTDGRALGAAA